MAPTTPSSSAGSGYSSTNSRSRDAAQYGRIGVSTSEKDHHGSFMAAMMQNRTKDYTAITWSHVNEGYKSSSQRLAATNNIEIYGTKTEPHKIVYNSNNRSTEYYPKGK